MRELLNKLDNVSADTVSEDGRWGAGRPHDFYRHDNYYGNPRQYGDYNRNFGVGMGIGALGALAAQNRGYPPGYYPQGSYPPGYYPQQYPQNNYPGTPPYFPPGSQPAPTPGYIQQSNPAPSGPTTSTTTTGPAVPVGPTTLGPTTYYGPNGEKSDKPFPQQDNTSGTAGSPSTTTKADADKADADKAAKIARFKELLAKADVSDKPTGLDSVDKPFNPDYSLTGGKSTGGIGLKESSFDGFARDPLLEKLRLIERGQSLYEGLTPDEYKELSKLYGDLSVTSKNDPKLAPLFAQYDKVPTSWASDSDKTAPSPADTTKPDTTTQQWAPGVLHVGSTGPEVIALQKQLGINADGKFGPATKEAVMAMQKKLGVTVDGAWGPKSKAAFAAKGGTAPSPSDTTKGDGKWTGSAKDWGSAIGGGLGAAGLGALGGATGALAGPAGAAIGAVGGGAVGHDIGADLGGKAGEWLGGVGDKIGKSWDAASNAWDGKSASTAAAPAKTTKESIEVQFADQLIESFGYESK